MPWWVRWFSYINPTFYAFESLMINEFSGRQFPCSSYIPQGNNYNDIDPTHRMCTTVGATPGSSIVNGDTFVASSFHHYASHKWRNLGIIFALMAFWFTVYMLAAQYIVLQKSRGEVLLFSRSKIPKQHYADAENPNEGVVVYEEKTKAPSDTISDALQELRSATFLWDGLSYDVKINKKTTKRVLDDIEGFATPGTLSMLMVRYESLTEIFSVPTDILGLVWGGKDIAAECPLRSNNCWYCDRRQGSRHAVP
jgi:hypothetical protein